jgi:hypothetical protein
MTPTCPRSESIQAYLDGELSPAQAEGLRGHAAGCSDCSAELALYDRVFTALRSAPIWDPGVAFTERVLDRVVPSRLRRRWVTAIGWGYGTVSAVTTFLFVSWLARPGTPSWIVERLGEAYVRLIQTGLFTLHAMVFSWLRVMDGWGWVGAMIERLAPLLRALALPLAQPLIGAVLTGATLACIAVLWWMRPRRARARKGVRHVSLLGF